MRSIYFGGYTEEILYDNMKQIVLKRAYLYPLIRSSILILEFFSIMASYRDAAVLIAHKQKARSRIAWVL